MASSLQLEISSNVELTNIGAVVRSAAEAAPTEAEALASKGHVSINIPADGTRKISISRHYTTDFDNGLTLADILAPNTAYKLYLYFPTGRITTTAEMTGLSITDDRAVVPFTTAALPAEGDAKWLSNIGSECIASLDTLYFMQKQTGVVVCYFYVNHDPLATDVSREDDKDTFDNVGTYGRVENGVKQVEPATSFHFAYGLIPGYIFNSTNRYSYFIGADKTDTLRNRIRTTIIDPLGLQTTFDLSVIRH
ncbi:hypothetical protein P0082_11195 [Candidatus Haliotispira prima]|uniref:Uncharacterized protein n=1 Tax=Candidatus Haliotispira prima TaxID=3034016 RepID=A0ABY8MGC7_9SPIO|nr:hypothetical protein P0082_11195 [Candidatus Haliotispira prima]